jgi:hypothetical protein
MGIYWFELVHLHRTEGASSASGRQRDQQGQRLRRTSFWQEGERMAASSLLSDCRFCFTRYRGEPNRTLSKLTGRGSSGKRQEGGLPFYYWEGEEKFAIQAWAKTQKHLAASKQGRRVCDATELKVPVGRHGKLGTPCEELPAELGALDRAPDLSTR